ncbi:hypothetical protein WA026_003375 [Henosepilachna vigintioctopunctata]|uniref:Uncharacterized protein n=1 Tax=Henosepilachna vigintioctopunctata TaxID=420089 RepID=A0AAW1TPD4_9CUCU
MLKLFFVFLSVFFHSIWSFDEDMQELIKNLHTTCVGEVGVQEELISRAQKGDFADVEELKCYTKCIFDQLAIADENGVADPEAALAVIPANMQATADPIIRKCTALRGSNPCDNVFVAMKCWYHESPETYFMP